MIVSGFALGFRLAVLMKKRVSELREMERTVHVLEGEIRYHHAILGEACKNAASRCGQPFSDWLRELYRVLAQESGEKPVQAQAWNEDMSEDMSEDMGEDMDEDMGEAWSEGMADNLVYIWERSLEKLYPMSHLTRRDMEHLRALGRCIGYLDIEAQEGGFKLECENIHACMLRAEGELANKMKLSVILTTLCGILIVIMLL